MGNDIQYGGIVGGDGMGEGLEDIESGVEKDVKQRFYILFFSLLFLSLIITYLNYKNRVVIPNLYTVTYDTAIKHVRHKNLLKNILKKKKI